MTKQEEFPEEIFNWLSSQSFIELNAEQKSVVLNHLNEEEYGEMRDALKSISILKSGSGYAGINSRKEQLLKQFEISHQSKQGTVGTNRPHAYWQAAAAVLFLICGWLSFQLLKPDSGIQNGLLSKTDTVYIKKEIQLQAEKIHDTVYIYKLVKENSQSVAKGETARELQGSYNDYPGLNSSENIPYIQLNEIDREFNNQRGNSMKDDSLLKKYGFVAM